MFFQDSTTKVKYSTYKHVTLYNQSESEGYIDIQYYVALLFDVASDPLHALHNLLLVSYSQTQPLCNMMGKTYCTSSVH